MNIIGFQDIAIADLVLPSNWEAILAEAETKDIAESVERIGIIHEPVVRHRKYASDASGNGGVVWTLIAGRHRVAAQQRRGEAANLDLPIRVFCKVVDCTDLEAELLTREENAQRWHNPHKRKELIRDLQSFYQALFEKRPELAPKQKAKGRKRTAQGSAALVVAKLTGHTPNAQKVRRYRQHKAEVAGNGKPIQAADGAAPIALNDILLPPEPKPPQIETFGLTVGDEFLAGVDAIRAHMFKARDLCAAAQGQLTQLEKLDLYPKGRLDRLKGALHDVTAMLGDAIPQSLCGFCKGLPGAVEGCAACLGSSIMGAAELGRVPSELLERKDPVVRVNGKLVAVADLLGDPFGEAV